MLFKKKRKPDFNKTGLDINIDPDALEIFINSSEDKYAELYFKHGAYTYTVTERKFEELENFGTSGYYWAPSSYIGGFFQTKEQAIKELMTYIEPKYKNK